MTRGSHELTHARRQEIVDACARLYATMDFQAVTIKQIGAATSFSRPSIYNYFATKEEIFLALLQQEYDEWAAALERIRTDHATLTADELAAALAHTLESRELLLKIQAMNLYEIEEHSRLEPLVAFKQSFFGAMDAMDRCLIKFRPAMTARQRTDFRYAFFPFIYGVYPYVRPTAKQQAAMAAAGIRYEPVTIYGITFRCLKKLLPFDAERKDI